MKLEKQIKMKKCIYLDGNYEYDYEELDGVHTLYFNNSECWQSDTRGTIAFSLTDDENGLIFSARENKNRLNYSESIYLTILLKLINADYTFEIGTKTEF